MKFGLDKWEKATFIKGKLQTIQNFNYDNSISIRFLDHHETYEYLRVHEHDEIQHKKKFKLF